MAAKNQKLTAADTEGVFFNERGVAVDKNGVALAFKALKKRDEDHRAEVLGHQVKEPHEFMKAVCMDPRYSLAVRMDAAKAAAPYFAAKKDGGGPGGSNSLLEPEEAAAAILAAVRAADATVLGTAPPAKAARK